MGRRFKSCRARQGQAGMQGAPIGGETVRAVRTMDATVDVAQLVESRVVIPVVVGSSPIVHPNPRPSACFS